MKLTRGSGRTTELGGKSEPAQLADRELQDFAVTVRRDLGLTKFDLVSLSDPKMIYLAFMTVPVAARGMGVGTEAMRRLVDFADRHRQPVRLYAGNKSTRNRLTRFYQRFGFVGVGPHGEMRRDAAVKVGGGGAGRNRSRGRGR